MNAKQELAGRVHQLVHDEIKPDTQRILDILADYTIGYSGSIQDRDLERLIEHFIFAKRAENVTTATIVSYRSSLRRFQAYTAKDAADISTADIRDYIAYLGDVRGNGINAMQTAISILRSFFGWLHQEELIPRNPMIRIKSYKIDKRDSRHPLTNEQLEMLRNACQTYREKAIVEFLYSSGCRVSEAVQIDVNAMDFSQRAVPVIGKGRKPRTLYFSVKAKLMIQHYLEERPGGTALFSAKRKPYKRLSKRALEIIIRDLGKRAGINRQVHPHILRHTLATDLINAGMDIVIIQQILGHSSVGTTQIYAEMSQESVQREYRKYVA